MSDAVSSGDFGQRSIARYWKREETPLGRVVNDVMDEARTRAGRVRRALPGTSQDSRAMFKADVQEYLEEKQWWRQNYQKTGRMETRDEVCARLDYALRNTSPADISVRRTELQGDATVDRDKVEAIVSNVMDRWKAHAAVWARAKHPPSAAEWDARDAARIAGRPSDTVANGWTRQEAEAMNAHLDAKAAREWERSEPSAESVRMAERMADATDPMHDERRERQADNHKPRERLQQENDIVASTSKQDGLSALDNASRELIAVAASAIQKVDWTYDRSPDPDVRREGFKHMRAAIHSLDAVVTHGGNIRAEYAMDAVDAVKQHTLRTEAASAIWQHHAPKMASETKEYYRPDWFYPERLHNHSWNIGKITAMGQEHRSDRPVQPTVERVADPMLSQAQRMADPTDRMHDARREWQADNYKASRPQQEVHSMDSEVRKAKQHVREREQERWTRVEQIGRQAIDSDRAQVTEKQSATTEADLATKAERQKPLTA